MKAKITEGTAKIKTDRPIIDYANKYKLDF